MNYEVTVEALHVSWPNKREVTVKTYAVTSDSLDDAAEAAVEIAWRDNRGDQQCARARAISVKLVWSGVIDSGWGLVYSGDTPPEIEI